MLWIDQGKDTAKGVVRRNPVRQLEKLPKPLLLGLAEQLNIRLRIHTTDRRANGHDDDIQKQVASLVAPCIFYVREMEHKRPNRRKWH